MSGRTPQPPSSRPPSNSRRRLLVALGFGAANVAVASQLGTRRTSTSIDVAGVDTGIVDLTADRAPLVPPSVAGAGPEVGDDHVFDRLITNCRIIDPETGFESQPGEMEVGINDGVITAIRPPGGSAVELLDVRGQVVAPGFIDILSAELNGFGEWLKVADGVTTNLAQHGVNNYANAFFERGEGRTPVHFGGAFHQHFLRAEDLGVKPGDALDEGQLAAFADLARANIANGFAGVSFSPEYSPGTSTAELDRLAQVAADAGHGSFWHVRYSDPDEPGTSLDAITEAIDVGRRAGIPVHIEHVSSTGGTFVMGQALDLIESARAEGLDVTACVYPYDFWATTLASYRFAGNWQERYRLTVGDLQVAGTEGRLTEATFDAAFAENKLVAAHGSIPEEELQMALRKPWVMIGSDAILTESLNNHPRASGTFARMLGRYVRELGVLDLTSGLAKMTILPAQRIEAMIPAMARKGRLQRGADADITIFDPQTISDQATVANPGLPSIGITHVMVAGRMVMRNGEVERNTTPGVALRSSV